MMGIFKKKESRASPDDSKSDKSLLRPAVAVERLSNYSHKSPKLISANFPSPSMGNNMPDIPIPDPPDPGSQPAAYLRSIHAVRQRTRLVLDEAKGNALNHFDVDMSKFKDTADYVVAIIKRDYAGDYASIPPHGRWQHFEVGGRPRVTQLLQSWPTAIDTQERARRLIDLFLVSVLLDAGAGTKWSYKSKESGKVYVRSEGLAVASLEMFKAGAFSSDPTQPHQVDAAGLNKVTVETLARGMQVSDSNPMSGLAGRAGLLIRLASALQNTEIFGVEGRPGNMIDYLISHPTTQAASVPVVLLPTLWSVLMDGLSSIWPATRTTIQGKSLGDAWPCRAMPKSPPAHPWETIVPFHKLTQWLCYSLMVPMTKLLNVHFAGAELMTGLPEYRNGGLLVDTGLLTLKEEDRQRGLKIYHHMVGDGNAVEVVPTFEPSDDVIVEWRAVTVGFLDELLAAVNQGLGLEGAEQLSLAQMLEAGTWKGGREIAQVSRPITKGPPIGIISDGTVF
ncbi:uncharacterized protein Z518_00763 [Rhinocladiella mackenziei CBS 650.93]|uniref:Rhinocladiella mackenziei CBS 650.93 unplaced genomic scaffold supercont1.1, whole genome shotgun sequence n=1 Tax=Rhinocladiella mackenziei CBS 650.93 TaxID=1442369 RepID=A0A0D2G4P2_9EURO|nr:uncharacterized protein Z518_00763 [Rhinocladiella mackenziei CBS 650.93]KIX09682.1 hypothetical protein Z518_00763 [Rhinocladiella mackenziei CBS 650.93]